MPGGECEGGSAGALHVRVPGFAVARQKRPAIRKRRWPSRHGYPAERHGGLAHVREPWGTRSSKAVRLLGHVETRLISNPEIKLAHPNPVSPTLHQNSTQTLRSIPSRSTGMDSTS